MLMELLYANYVNTSSQLAMVENDSTKSYLLDPDERFQWATSNYTGATTGAFFTITFSATTTIDRLWFKGHNWKSFRVYYNGLTTSTFSLDGADTTTSHYTTNSNTSHYFRLATGVGVTSVTVQIDETINTANRYVGYIGVSEVRTDFDGRAPNAQGYRPNVNPMQAFHRMSDGGVRTHTVKDKHQATVHLDYITEASRNELLNVWKDHAEMVFVPNGTAASWDAHIFPCVWTGDFRFYEYSDNAETSGYSGVMELYET